jgi:hypothetical protein
MPDLPMKLVSTRIDFDETGSGKFRVAVSYHEGDAADRLGQSAEIIVYVDADGRRLPDDVPAISTEAVQRARHFLRSILDETDDKTH